MTASVTPSVRRAATTPSGPSFARVVRAEWTKLLGLRSTLAVAVATVVVTGLLTHLFASASSGDPGFVPTRNLADALPLAFLGPLVLGILVGTGEFSTGTFRSTFAAVPRRVPVLLAQAVVTAAVVLGVGVLTVGAAVLGILPAAGSRGMTPDLADAGIPLLLLGSVCYLVGAGLLGLAIGALLRRPVPAMVAAVVLLLVAPVVLSFAAEAGSDPMAVYDPEDVPAATAAVNTVETFTPVGAGSGLTNPDGGGLDGAPDLGLGGSALVMAGWVVVPLIVAAFRWRRRDLG
ncbi:ABC transporter permease subunit [Kineococcus radiotolerans]|uniref:Integral membrane protein n=1 Tax=Kineococcus radiotolerans (strain ATCC BAA-149 / DSM 14245 / SRS30216) TaxID=266940 RepID=A6W9H5_KINRD|nr:ABC transporter permease subunit [Kineococcus radiotolerans]ABS03464.1 integral membrane protein [Kineococcus radiotolerans SRS30216 = ATCC BAA-149]